MYIHKNGICLRKLTKSDLPLLLDLKNESWFGTHNIKFVNIEDQEKWFNALDDTKNLILIADDLEQNQSVGVYKIQNLDWINRKYDSAHDIFSRFRGNGYSKKVLSAGIDFGFEILNINRIDSEVLENNIASYKSAIDVGFLQEGIKRNCIYKCGSYLNSIVIGILRSDWEQLDRIKEMSGICNKSYTPKNGK